MECHESEIVCCRPTKATPKRKATKKEEEDADEEDEAADDNDQEDKACQPKVAGKEEEACKPKSVSSKKAPAKKKKSQTKAAKDGPENSSKTANKNPTDDVGDVDEVHENLQDKYYMHKYKDRDLNKGKGDLDGLVPYTVAQILEVQTSKGKKAGVNHISNSVLPSDVERVHLVLQNYAIPMQNAAYV